jgi:hypothetical protein
LLTCIGLKSSQIPQEWSDDDDENEKKSAKSQAVEDLDFEGMAEKYERQSFFSFPFLFFFFCLIFFQH